jgi:hypothetical protein
MAVGDKIRTVDYNSLQTRVSNILGTGSGDLGYGQLVQSSQVSTSTNVTVNEWGNLRNDIVNIYRHQNNALPDTSILPQVTEGNKVRFSASDEPVTVWDGFITTVQNNRSTAPPAARTASQFSATRSASVSWSGGVSTNILITWSGSSPARWFFNSGGRIRVTTSFTSSLGNSQGISWTNILSGAGTQSIGGYGSPDWYSLTTSFQNFYTTSGTSPYGANSYTLSARTPGGNNSTGNQNILEIAVTLTDNYTDPPTGDPDNPPPDDFVAGLLTVDVSYLYGSGALTGSASTWQGYLPGQALISSYTTF